VSDTEMRQVILDLLLEDLIPLWEIADACRGEGSGSSADESERLSALSETLVNLFRSGHIRVFVGPWQQNDPAEAEPVQSEALLRDLRRYSVVAEQREDLDRVYYVNDENLPH
jgi:hypothetical protein